MSAEDSRRRSLHRRTAWLYEPIRRRFEDRQAGYQNLRADLNAARMGVTVDDYLARSAVFAVTVGVVGFVVGVVLTVWLGATGTLASLQGISGTGTVGAFVGANRAVFVGAGLGLGLGVVAGLGTWYYRYTHPGRVANRRARTLSLLLPHAITYMYSLSRGGLDVTEIIRRLANSEQTYGELAREMGLVVNQMDYLGQDLLQAVRTASEITPCTYTSEFLGDLHSVIESGGDVEAFLANQREEASQDARAVQRDYIENISLFAEVYVTVLIAGPLFLLILLMVLGITGSETLLQVNLMVYVGVPGASVLALLVLDQMSAPFRQTKASSPNTITERPSVPDDPDAQDYAAQKRREKRLERLRSPLDPLLANPQLALVVSVPAAFVALGLFVGTGLVEPSLNALYESAFVATTLLFVVPFVIAATPLVLLTELRRRRTATINNRFPEVLSSIASANRMGIRPTEAIETAAEGAEHSLTEELQALHNEIQWFDDLQGSLLRLARRARTPVTSRALRLVVEADQASGNLSETLSVVAEDARRQRSFIRDRTQALSMYVATAIISFFVYLGILLLVREYYFEEAVIVGQQAGPENPTLPVRLQSLNVEGFTIAFFHSALVQALFIGLVAGKMTTGEAIAGLKYSLALILLTIVAFGVV